MSIKERMIGRVIFPDEVTTMFSRIVFSLAGPPDGKSGYVNDNLHWKGSMETVFKGNCVYSEILKYIHC